MTYDEALKTLLDGNIINSEEYEMLSARVSIKTAHTYAYLASGFEDYLKAQGKSETTVQHTVCFIKRFIARDDDFNAISDKLYTGGAQDCVTYYIEHTNAQECTMREINTHNLALRKFNLYLISIREEEIKLGEIIKFWKDNGLLTDVVIREFIDINRVALGLPLMTRTVFFMQYDLCLSLRNLVNIRFEDIDFQRRTIEIDGHKYVCSPFLWKTLEKYVVEFNERRNAVIEYRKERGIDTEVPPVEFLFISRKQTPYSYSSMRRALAFDLEDYFRKKGKNEQEIQNLIGGFRNAALINSKIAFELKRNVSPEQICAKYPSITEEKVYLVKLAM